MTTEQKLIRKKLSLIDLAEDLQNVSQARKINGVSRQHFYDIKKAFDEEGMEGLIWGHHTSFHTFLGLPPF
jgi:hypothetical protein